ncbi:DUF5979 domain-containing protein [Nocardioides campestrisoli]|uniref:DUF5979 domain-containing protein n=1 Tax=Nocardioides campestrisoli TaxID=2736757 RepID=UPI0015E652FA|nr:DUF5979 domain-containing protein [Nocardioides campestrisoli]
MNSILTTWPRKSLRIAVVLALTSVLLVVGRPAQAEPIPGGELPLPGRSAFTELQVLPISGAQGVSNVGAVDAPPGFNPLDGYPEAVPEGSTPHDISYMGLIPARDADGATALTYCIDLFTSTETGVNYQRDDWTEANVPNLGYVAHILQNYFPTEPLPADVPDNVKAAAVQAAIWFFSDNLVLDPTAEPQLFPLTSAIVADALANGPVGEPQPPDLSVSPESAEAPLTGELVGPFTVASDGPATLRLAGVEVFTDAAGTQQLADGDPVPADAQLWVRTVSADPEQGFALQREEEVRESTVYLYDGSNPDRESAQKLILAQTTRIEAVAGVRITPFEAGGIEVTKTISGPGAGLQGPVSVRAVCTPADGGAPIERRLRIPAGTGAGSSTVTTTGLPAGATCTISEPENGDNDQVDVTAVAIAPERVTIVADQNTAVAVSNTYAIQPVIPTPTPTPITSPSLASRTSEKRVEPGQRFHDRVRVTGLARGTTVPATARLYGPFRSRAGARCEPSTLARTVTWRAGAGWSRTPGVRLRQPGVYTWRVNTRATAENGAASTRCGLASETTTVAKAPYRSPVVNGGFSGTLPGAGTARVARTVVRAPALGLDATVVPTTVRRGQMRLPGNVGVTAWLRRSAGFGDAIGTAVVAGHVSDRHDRPGAMWGLRRAEQGQVVTVASGGKTYRYRVSETARFDRTRRLPQRFFATTGAHRLVLISCTARVTYANGRFHYTKYQVVVAKRLGGKG